MPSYIRDSVSKKARLSTMYSGLFSIKVQERQGICRIEDLPLVLPVSSINGWLEGVPPSRVPYVNSLMSFCLQYSIIVFSGLEGEGKAISQFTKISIHSKGVPIINERVGNLIRYDANATIYNGFHMLGVEVG